MEEHDPERQGTTSDSFPLLSIFIDFVSNRNLCFVLDVLVTLQKKMTTPQVKTGLFVGLNKGHVVTRRELAPRPRARKGVCFSVFAIVLVVSTRIW